MKPILRTYAGDFSLTIAAMLYGTTFFVMKLIQSGSDSVAALGWRYTIAGVLLLLATLALRKNPFTNWKWGVLAGLVLYLLMVPQVIGLQYTSASNSGFITGLFVVFVGVLQYVWFRTPIAKHRLFAIVLALIGLWLLTGGVHGVNIGDLITVLAALFYAVDILILTHISQKLGTHALVLSFQHIAVAGMLALLTAPLIGESLSVTTTAAWQGIVYLAVFGSAIAVWLQVWGQQFVTPVRAGLLLGLEPLFGAVFAAFFIQEQLGVTAWLGGICIVLAIGISELK